jgi:nucleoside-diphosphate-sugar epimerase
MSNFIANRRFVPLVGSGKQLIQTIAVEDLCLIIEKGLEMGICGIFRIAHPSPIPLRAIYEAVTSHRGKRVFFIPAPVWFLLSACRLAEFFRIHLPVASDSILGLKHVRVVDTISDLAVFGVEPKAFEESL